MNIKNLITAGILFAAAGSAAADSVFFQQAEFVAPDAGFKSSLNRAEVRQDLARTLDQGPVAQHQHDRHGNVHADADKNRQDVKAEQGSFAK